MYEGRKMGNLRDSLFFVSFWMFLNCLMVPPLSNIKMTTFTNSTKKKMKRKQRQTVNEMYRNRLLIYHFRLCIWYHLFYIVDTFFSLAIALSDFSAAHSIDFSPSLFIWSGYKKNHVKIKHKPIACIYKTVEMFRHNFKLRCLLFVFRSLKLVFHWIHFPLQDFFFCTFGCGRSLSVLFSISTFHQLSIILSSVHHQSMMMRCVYSFKWNARGSSFDIQRRQLLASHVFCAWFVGFLPSLMRLSSVNRMLNNWIHT